MMERAGPYLILIGRVLLSVIFIQSGWSKIFGYAGTVEHSRRRACRARSFRSLF
jgi:uncharacterized membrane protein YphA (DoxX/SURF4 family)